MSDKVKGFLKIFSASLFSTKMASYFVVIAITRICGLICGKRKDIAQGAEHFGKRSVLW